MRLDHDLITAFIECGRQETYIFHLPVIGEITITLQNVEMLWGMNVDRLPITLVQWERSKTQQKQLVHKLLKFWPKGDDFNDAQLKMKRMY